MDFSKTSLSLSEPRVGEVETINRSFEIREMTFVIIFKSFLPSFIHSFIQSFVRSFIHSVIITLQMGSFKKNNVNKHKPKNINDIL